MSTIYIPTDLSPTIKKLLLLVNAIADPFGKEVGFGHQCDTINCNVST